MGVLENMREVADIVKQIGDIEPNRKILNLEKEVHELSRAKMRLGTELEQKSQLLNLKQAMGFRDPFYYTGGDDVPHCPACWKAKDIAVHVVFVSNREGEIHWQCPSCQHHYYDKKDRSEKPRPGSRALGPYSGGPNGWMR